MTAEKAMRLVGPNRPSFVETEMDLVSLEAHGKFKWLKEARDGLASILWQ